LGLEDDVPNGLGLTPPHETRLHTFQMQKSVFALQNYLGSTSGKKNGLMFSVTNAEFNLLIIVTTAINVDATINLNFTYSKLTIRI
jgi:hypothetical protein